jgi:phosphomannomutase
MNGDDLRRRASRWIHGDPDPTTAAELQALVDGDDEASLRELAERMAGPLTFGTAGLRGIIGAGEHRMNRAVVRRTTAGLAQYVVDSTPDARERGVVVGYDGRRFSDVFARDTACVLAGVGVRAHLFRELGPTPLLAFAVRRLGAAAGIMVTASHNPPRYNGYKVYWDNGAQIVPPHDAGISAAIDRVGEARSVTCMDLEDAVSRDLVRWVPDEVATEYMDGVAALSRDRRGRDRVRIVYTPMHGVGDPYARAALSRFGFGDVRTVPEQQEPDPEFSTVSFPNPEEPGALDLALALARERSADLVIANDPDADRLAVAVRASGRPGGYRQLTGNEVGVLLGEYLVRTREPGRGPGLLVTTIASSPMLGEIARREGLLFRETLTGFKWIFTAALAGILEHGADFVFGYEEALGYAVSDLVRDKDGISAAAIFAELTAAAAAEGRTVEDELERLARRYGLFASRQVSLVRTGMQGAQEIATMMDTIRGRPPDTIGDGDGGGARVLVVRDLLAGARVEAGQRTQIDLPRSNVLILDLEGGARVVMRPSGTEPKLKIYFDVREDVRQGDDFGDCQRRAESRLDLLSEAFLRLIGS